MDSSNVLGLFFGTVIALLFLVLGHKFRQGKMLRFIAGNSACYDERSETSEQGRMGKQAAFMMTDVGCATLFFVLHSVGELASNKALSQVSGLLALALLLVFILYFIKSMIINKRKSR